MLNYLKLISRESCYKQWLSKPRGCLLEISFRLKWNIFISVSCDFLQLFIWYNPKWNSLPVLYHCGHFDRNEISFRVIKHHVNTTRNEMPTHFQQNIGSFWNAAEMKLHVNWTCFHAGLKSQTGMISFRLSSERTLTNTLY